MSRKARYAEHFVDGRVDELGSHRVTEEEIVEFARVFDPQPYHVSESEASRSCFKGLIASGWHTASIWMGLYVRAVLVDTATLGSPGVDELRWLQPVRPGDELSGRAEVVGRIPSLSDPKVVTVKKLGTLRRADGALVCSLKLNSRFQKSSTPHLF